jgi:hypothetical protein
MNNLLHSHKEILNQLEFIRKHHKVEVVLDENIADTIRKLAADIVVFHFDENYEPTKEGWILEHFIDKFFFDKHVACD